MTTLQPWPEHQNPTNQGRIASAPYNFVPLPEKIIPAVDSADELPDHDKYYQDRHSGYFDVTLTTRSPLYIRGPLPSKDFPRQEEFKNKPEFFYTHNEREPVIPGSSLRGMLRALLEIASYSKMQWVSEKRLFFRTLDNTAVGNHYRARMSNHVETGFLIRRGDTYRIKVCSMARVRRSLVGSPMYSSTRPQVPVWQGQPRQYARVWIKIQARKKRGKTENIVEQLSYKKHERMIEGRLVITGDMQNKKKEFVFLLPEDNAKEIAIPADIISRFHDEDQLTQWQEKAFPINQPTAEYRDRDGMLGKAPDDPGDPIFFLRENEKPTFIGRAYMFRLPYEKCPIDLVPNRLRQDSDIDYAEALFGFVRTHKKQEAMKTSTRQGNKSRAYAGRVIVTDGVLQSDPTNIWLTEDPDKEITGKILATPKPTAFQQYLTQHNPNDKEQLNHYDSTASDNYKTVIRGHKLYWHQGLGTEQDLGTNRGLTPEEIRTAISEELTGKEPEKGDKEDTQHPHFKPLQPGVAFSFRVYFENLSDRELGALCWTLHPRGEQGKRYCHHLGMGKPLGMGAVELHARLHIIDRPQRYKTLFDGDIWQVGEAATVEDLADAAVLALRTQEFERHLLDELNPACTRLADMRRIAMLLKLLEWPGYPLEENGGLYLDQEGRPNTRYMKIQYPNEYQKRPVLPDPTKFDEPSYFHSKLRPQVSQADQLQVNRMEQNSTLAQQSSMPEAHRQAATRQQAPVKEKGQQLVLSSELAELFPLGRELIGLTNFTRNEQGIEVKFWKLDPMKVIGFLPNDLIDRKLGQKISVVVTGLHQEINGRVVVELKLRSK